MIATGYLFKTHFFWVSPTIGWMFGDMGVHENEESYYSGPYFGAALGVDIPLGEHLALRLEGQADMLMFVLPTVSTSGGLVVRF
jgi:hypothetical protein